jgi:hypothetical protein
LQFTVWKLMLLEWLLISCLRWELSHHGIGDNA